MAGNFGIGFMKGLLPGLSSAADDMTQRHQMADARAYQDKRDEMQHLWQAMENQKNRDFEADQTKTTRDIQAEQLRRLYEQNKSVGTLFPGLVDANSPIAGIASWLMSFYRQTNNDILQSGPKYNESINTGFDATTTANRLSTMRNTEDMSQAAQLFRASKLRWDQDQTDLGIARTRIDASPTGLAAYSGQYDAQIAQQLADIMRNKEYTSDPFIDARASGAAATTAGNQANILQSKEFINNAPVRQLTNDFMKQRTLNELAAENKKGQLTAPGGTYLDPITWAQQTLSGDTSMPLATRKKYAAKFLDQAVSKYGWSASERAAAQSAIDNTFFGNVDGQPVRMDPEQYAKWQTAEDTRQMNALYKAAQIDALGKKGSGGGGGGGAPRYLVNTALGPIELTGSEALAEVRRQGDANSYNPKTWAAETKSARDAVANQISSYAARGMDAPAELHTQLEEMNHALASGPPKQLGKGGPWVGGDYRSWDNYGGQNFQNFANSLVGTLGRTEADRVLREAANIVQMIQQGGATPDQVYPTLKASLRRKYPSLANLGG